MSQLPISTIRTSDILSQARLIRQLNGDNIALQGLYDQLSTGRRVNTLSDDPAAAISAISLQASSERATQFVRNSVSAEGYLNVTDTVVADIDNLLIEAHGTVVAAAQTPLSQSERDAYAETIERAIDRIIGASNQSYRGHFVLGGSIEQGQPLSAHEGSVVWSGDDSVQSTQVSPSWNVETGVSAQAALGVGGLIAESTDLGVGITPSTPLKDLFDGRGVTPGVIQLAGNSSRAELDLRDAKTIGDVMEAIEVTEIDSRALALNVTGGTFTISYADGLSGNLAIQDVGQGELAEKLGIANPDGVAAPVQSHDLSPSLSLQSRISDLLDGNGLDVSSGFNIHQGQQQYHVDLSSAETIDDIIVAIERSGADVRVVLEPSKGGFQIQALANGVDYAVSESSGNVASLLGIRTSTEQTRLDELNRGQGFRTVQGSDLSITLTDGTALTIDVDGAETIGDVLALINGHPANIGPSAVVATLRDNGNGIQLTSAVGTRDLRVQGADRTDVAQALGLVPPGQQASVSVIEAGIAIIRGEDYRSVEAGGTLDTLIRLRQAIQQGDIQEITRLSPRLDDHLRQSSIVRGEVGSRTRNLEAARQQTEDFNIQLTEQLSEQLDADFASVLSEMTARQTALEASLRVIAQISQLSVLNFI